jgi:hypothetical protein
MVTFEKFTLNGIEYNYAPFMGISISVDGIIAGYTGTAPWGFTRLNKAQLNMVIKKSLRALTEDLSMNQLDIIKRAIACAEETLAKM